MKKKKAAEHGSTSVLFTHIEQALEHFTDPQWLGDNSPLAAPYLLSRELMLQTDPAGSVGRGKALQRFLLHVAEHLISGKDKSATDAFKLLQTAYFRTRASRNLSGVAFDLGLSPATFFRHRQDAIRRLEQAYLRLSHPSIRIESPHVTEIIGRQRETRLCADSLREGKIVSLTGPPGVGKSTLGAYVASMADPNGAYWFTLRPQFGSNVDSFVFSVALFLRQRGVPLLWLQLMADRGQANQALALQLTRQCLSELSASSDETPVMCIDEVDLLQTSPIEPDDHAKLRAFLEDLLQAPRPKVGVLFIGQQLLWDSDLHFAITGLAQHEVRDLLANHAIEIDRDVEDELCRLTQGNPLLLKLLIALHQSGEPLSETLSDLPSTPSYGFLLERINRRLGPYERNLLSALSVYERACPRDAWQEASEVVERLIDRGLVVADRQGGISLQPVVRELMYRRLSAEEKLRFHLAAAGVFAERGLYTGAASHYVQANRPEIAVAIWYLNRDNEINNGQARAAKQVFSGVPRDNLPAEEARQLALVRAQLEGLSGNTESGLDELANLKWPLSNAYTPGAMELQGWFKVLQGQLDAALVNYRRGFDSVSQQLQEQQISLLARMSGAQLKNRDLSSAWRTALIAKHTAEALQGDVQEQGGNFDAARVHFQFALDAADELDDDLRRALSHFRLGSLAIRFEDGDTAVRHLEAAMHQYQKIGDALRAERTRSNLAVMHLHVGRFKSAIEQAQEALAFFERLHQPYWTALNATNIAEAYFYLQDYAHAEQYAWRALREEEAGLRSYALCTLGQVHRARGDLMAAERYCREAISAAQDAQDRWAEAPAWRALGLVLRGMGDETQAGEAFAKALALYEAMQLSKEAQRTQSIAAQGGAPPSA